MSSFFREKNDRRNVVCPSLSAALMWMDRKWLVSVMVGESLHEIMKIDVLKRKWVFANAPVVRWLSNKVFLNAHLAKCYSWYLRCSHMQNRWGWGWCCDGANNFLLAMSYLEHCCKYGPVERFPVGKLSSYLLVSRYKKPAGWCSQANLVP